MKRILISLLVIGLVGGLAFGLSSAFFSDTEESSGNTLQAGAIDLKIDNTSYYNGQLSDLTTWGPSDLNDGQGPNNGIYNFFYFTDIKPGDWGEDTISIRVDTNNAWACYDIAITSNDDVDCTGPEQIHDPTCDEPNDNDFDGELGDQVQFVFWVDDGDNVLETNEQEDIIAQGTATQVLDGLQGALADSQNGILGLEGGPLEGETTYYLAKAWCFGSLTLTPVPPGQAANPTEASGIECSGDDVNNAAQTDKLLGDITFTAIQSRNNENYLCTPEPTPTPTPIPDPGEPYIDSVISTSGTFGAPSTLSSSTAVAEPLVTGAPDDQFIQISDNTVMVFAFVDNKAVNGTGDDIRIHIYDVLFPATATIEISHDGSTFVPVGNHPDTSDVDIDINDYGLTQVTHIRITDIVDGAGDQYPLLGFDLDAIEALNSVIVP